MDDRNGFDGNQSGPLPVQQPVIQQAQQIPDVTATRQVRTSFSNPMPETPRPPAPRTASGFPRIIAIMIVTFIMLLVVFLGIKFFGGFLAGGGNSKVTLVYWGLWEDKNVMQTVINDFQRLHPNILVQYSKQDPQQYSKSVLTRIQNGTGPDIFRYHVSWLPMMLPSLLPLSTNGITKKDFVNAYYPVVQRDLTKNGAIYGIPLGMDTLTLFINKKIFDEAKAQVPTTWDGFIATARALTTKDATGKIQIAGAAMGTFDNITHGPDIISLLLVQNGVNLATMTPVSNASDAIVFYTSFVKDQGNVWDNTLDPSLLAFERGKLAMYIGYSWDIFAIKAVSPDLDFATYQVPHLPGRDMTIASYWVEGVSTKTQHPKEAMEFMHFLSEKDTAAKLYTQESKLRLFGEPYARVDLADSLKNTPLVYPFVSQASNASSSFFAGETQDTGIPAQMNGYLGNAINSILKDTSPDSAVGTLTKGVTQVLSQYGN